MWQIIKTFDNFADIVSSHLPFEILHHAHAHAHTSTVLMLMLMLKLRLPQASHIRFLCAALGRIAFTINVVDCILLHNKDSACIPM